MVFNSGIIDANSIKMPSWFGGNNGNGNNANNNNQNYNNIYSDNNQNTNQDLQKQIYSLKKERYHNNFHKMK